MPADEEDEDLLDDEMEDQDLDDDNGEEEEDESPAPRASRRSRRSQRSGRGGGRSRRDNRSRESRPAADPLSKNYTVAFIVSIFLGVLGVDRFILGEFGLGAVKLVGSIIFGVLWFVPPESLGGIDPPLATAIALFALIGMTGTVQLHDLLFYGMKTIGWVRPYARVYCSACKEEMELDVEQEDIKMVVCSYEDCHAHAPPPDKNVVKAVQLYAHEMVNHSLFALSLFISAVTSFVAGFHFVWPLIEETKEGAAMVAWPTAEGVHEGLQVILIGSAILGLMMLWQMACAEREKPLLCIA